MTANLSDTAARDTAAALRLLFDVDDDVVRAFRAFVASGRAAGIAEEVSGRLRRGGRIFFTGCGSTGRLSIQLVSIWRDFWQRQRARGLACTPSPAEWEDRAFSVMAGGDFALIKAVEGFEDFTAFGKKQIGDLGVAPGDVVFAITEGGETSFVIGTAWKGVETGAKVYFVYNNPDDILCAHVERSREVIQDPRIEKINLTTGPMAITGSTRMQATTIQLCVMLTVMEMTLRDLLTELEPGGPCALAPAGVPAQFLAQFEVMLGRLKEPALLDRLAALVELEEATYRAGRKHNYFADRYGIDILTDTTERSPTYCTPAFRKFDDATASESWAYLFVPDETTPAAWERLIRRRPACVEWSEEETRALVAPDKLDRTLETVRKISCRELMRFKVGLDGLPARRLGPGDSAAAIVSGSEVAALASPDAFHRARLEEARSAGARIGLVAVGRARGHRAAQPRRARAGLRHRDGRRSRFRLPAGRGRARRPQDAAQRALHLHDGPPRARDGQLHGLARAEQPEAHRPRHAVHPETGGPGVRRGQPPAVRGDRVRGAAHEGRSGVPAGRRPGRDPGAARPGQRGGRAAARLIDWRA